MREGMQCFVSKRNIWSSWDNLKSLQNAPQTPLRRPPGLPKTRQRRPQDASKTPPKSPFCFQDALGCPPDAPGAPRESLQDTPGLDFGCIPDPQILGKPPRNLSQSGRRTDGQMDRRTDGQMDRWTDVSAVAGTQLCCALDTIIS